MGIADVMNVKGVSVRVRMRFGSLKVRGANSCAYPELGAAFPVHLHADAAFAV